jgi:hypothetical protein
MTKVMRLGSSRWNAVRYEKAGLIFERAAGQNCLIVMIHPFVNASERKDLTVSRDQPRSAGLVSVALRPAGVVF